LLEKRLNEYSIGPGDTQDKTPNVYIPTLNSKKQEDMAGKIKKEVVDYKDFGKGPTIDQSVFSDHYNKVNQKLLGQADGPYKAPLRTDVYTRVG
jgi:hypothetical protein